MGLKIVEPRLLRRVTQLLHSGDRFPRTFKIACMRASQRVTVFDQGLHEWKRRPVWDVWNDQGRCRRPIIPLERVTCRNGRQSVSRTEFELRICLSHFGCKVDNLLGLGVLGLLQIRIGHVIERV